MKALSVRQPWASLIASGKKTIELRTRKINFRGDVLICVSKHKQGTGPKGVAICIAEIIDCRPAIKDDSVNACCEISQNEYAWILTNIRPVSHFPVKGSLGLFDVEVPSSVFPKKESHATI